MATEVRQPIDVSALVRYLEREIPSIPTPLDIKQFSNGQSNPTYLLRSRDKQQYVLRKKPPAPSSNGSGHNMEREYRIISALQSSGVPVPRLFGLCLDESIIGTQFYIMEFLDGRIFDDPWLPTLQTSERCSIWEQALQTLAKLHTVDLSAIGLQEWKRDAKFYDRQISVFSRISTAQAGSRSAASQQLVGQVPYFEELSKYFSEAKSQPQERRTLIHGDFKIDNLVFHKTEPRVIGVLDWELATEGHPLADLANLLSPMLSSAEDMTWLAEETLTEDLAISRKMFRPEKTKGLPDIPRCLSWYTGLSGWEVRRDEMLWAAAFHSFRTAVIMQGIAARLLRGQTNSVKARSFALQTLPYAFLAHARVQRIKDTSPLPARL